MQPPQNRFALNRIVWAVLSLSFLLRAYLAWRGGQYFWPDEDRFDLASRIAGLIQDGRFHDAVDRLLGQPDHLLFKVAALVPAGLQQVTGAPVWIATLFFAAASTWVLWLIHRLALAAPGGNPLVALVALILAASTNALFYYSRHYFPYDLSLGFFLLSLLTTLRAEPSPKYSFWAGFWAALGYLTYNGYWSLGAVLLALHLVYGRKRSISVGTRLAFALLGLVLPVLGVAIVSRLFGHDFFALTLAFAGTANQGELDHPGVFFVLYYWSSEHGLAVLWTLALALALGRAVCDHEQTSPLWPGLVMALGILLLAPPGLVHHFAVTARHVRVLAPFLCLVTASVLCSHPLLLPRPRLVQGLIALVVIQAAFNFAAPLAQVFPRDFEMNAIRFLAEARRSDLGPYRIVNASFLHNANWAPAAPDAGKVLLRQRHPFQFAPYLFEGYSLALRDRYLMRDLSMRIVRLDAGGAPFNGYPSGMLELTLRFPEAPEGLLPEPLLSTGAPGCGDTLFIRFEGRDRFVLGHDHFGGGATLAPAHPLDRSRTHRVLIGMDTFFPRDRAEREGRRFVIWDDYLLLDGRVELHPTAPEQITIGHNFIGASTAISQLSAEIRKFRRILYPRLGASFPQAPGALRLELLHDPGLTPGQAEPLLSSGIPGTGDVLFLQLDAGNQLRVGLDQWGRGAVLSAPFPCSSSRPLEFVVALGSFSPAAGNTLRDRLDRRRLFVSCNGRILLNRYTTFSPTRASDLALGENRAASTMVTTRLTSEILVCEAVASTDPIALAPGFPGPMRLRLQFSAPPAAGQSFPLVCTGKNGAGDLLFIRFDAQGRFQIGHDHWGYSMALSQPRAFDSTRPLDLLISMGSLLRESDHPESALHRHLFVAVDGDVILDAPARFHAAGTDTWVVGLNAIGSSSADEVLPADVIDFLTVPAETLQALISQP